MNWLNTNPELIPELIANKLSELLRTQSVTWFVSGGSNITYQAKSIELLQQNGADLSRLRILLIDERFGPVGHADSNWQQLADAGFAVPGPTYIAPFTENEQLLDDAVIRYAAIVENVLQNDSYTFAQLGMGDDGHTAGILPNSAATESSDTVVGYASEPYQRMTLGFSALRQLDEVALVAFGDSKQAQLDRLQETVDPKDQPVQVIKDIEHVTIYT